MRHDAGCGSRELRAGRRSHAAGQSVRSAPRDCFHFGHRLDGRHAHRHGFQLGQTMVEVTDSGWCQSHEGSAAASLAGASMQGATLTGVNLNGVSLAGADLTNADLRGAIVAGGVLTGAKLIGAKLQGLNLEGLQITHANLTGAHLAGCKLPGVDLTGTILVSTDFTGVDLTTTTMPSPAHAVDRPERADHFRQCQAALLGDRAGLVLSRPHRHRNRRTARRPDGSQRRTGDTDRPLVQVLHPERSELQQRRSDQCRVRDRDPARASRSSPVRAWPGRCSRSPNSTTPTLSARRSEA